MKKLGLVLISAIAFDLGTVVATSHATQVDYFLKIDGVHENGFMKFKLDKVNDASACRPHGGTIVTFSGQDFCRVPEATHSSSDTKQTSKGVVGAGPGGGPH